MTPNIGQLIFITLERKTMNPKQRQKCLRYTMHCLNLTLAAALFGLIYESFSHGVYAYNMIYAFLFPLIGGVLPGVIIVLRDKGTPPDISLTTSILGLITLTIGSLSSGVLEIYGTTSVLTPIYWAGGAVLIGISIAAAIHDGAHRREKMNKA